MAKVVEIIDVDDLPDPSSDDSEIVFTGFKREASRSSVHSDLLNTEGFVYTGFNETPKPPPPQRPSQPLRLWSNTRLLLGHRHRSTAGPPSKRQKRTHEPTTTNPHLKRDHATMRTQSRNCVPASDVIYISDSDDEKPEQKVLPLNRCCPNLSLPSVHMDIDIQEEEYATAHAALDLDYRANKHEHTIDYVYSVQELFEPPFPDENPGGSMISHCGQACTRLDLSKRLPESGSNHCVRVRISSAFSIPEELTLW
ncbi:hypothetical protein BD414DRAFT_506238 [Trametes punicea]|nr:hypothetical protein BD414DRAFT_506238 [Trametes punicea]